MHFSYFSISADNCDPYIFTKIRWICIYLILHFNWFRFGLLQRWKNIRACKQCLCKFFHSLGKICDDSTLFFCKSELCCNFVFWGWYLWLLNFVICFTFTLKRGQKNNYDIIIASIVVWRSYFAHNCCQNTMLFCCKFTFLVFYTPTSGKIVLALSLLVLQKLSFSMSVLLVSISLYFSLWESCEKVVRTFWESCDKVVIKLRESCEKAMRNLW